MLMVCVTPNCHGAPAVGRPSCAGLLGKGSSQERAKVCGGGGHLDTTVHALRYRGGQRRQDHLGEGPTEEVLPAKRSGPTDQ